MVKEMDIVRFKGGLGNQLFQYAFLRALEEKKGRKVGANIEYYNERHDSRKFELLDSFIGINLNCDTNNEYNKKRIEWEKGKSNADLGIGYDLFYIEKEPFEYDPGVFKAQESVYVGYWQSYLYFETITNILKNELKFNVCDTRILSVADYISHGDYCSVHIRLGDYIKAPQIYGDICTREYYVKAMQMMREYNPDIKFIVFSDDIQGAYELLGGKYEYVKFDIVGERSLYDLFFMTCCKANIIANSSFSWWGAYLNRNKISRVIAPKKWVNNRTAKDIICKTWIQV